MAQTRIAFAVFFLNNWTSNQYHRGALRSAIIVSALVVWENPQGTDGRTSPLIVLRECQAPTVLATGIPASPCQHP